MINEKFIPIKSANGTYSLPFVVIDKMRDTIDKAHISGKEHGFNLCIDDKDNIIKPGDMCKGKECSIETAEFRCKENEKSIGIFHTHRKESYPSMSDLSMGYITGMNCIGSFEEIKCFARKNDLDALAFADIKNVEHKEKQTADHYSRWRHKEISDREYRNIYSKYKKEVDRIIDNYFNTIKVR